jgi:hypothetical protein
MVRANLLQLLGNVEDPKPAASAAPHEPLVPPSVTPDCSTKTQPAKSTSATTASTPAAKPAKFDTLLRKETRIRDDQQTGLTALARRLSGAKTPGGERITENTLIRISIDLLLAQESRLAGDDEASLRRSIGL